MNPKGAGPDRRHRRRVAGAIVDTWSRKTETGAIMITTLARACSPRSQE